MVHLYATKSRLTVHRKDSGTFHRVRIQGIENAFFGRDAPLWIIGLLAEMCLVIIND